MKIEDLDWTEQPATAEDIASLAQPPSEEERAEILSLCRWFMRRYPTFGERTRYIRRKWREAQAWRGRALSKSTPIRRRRGNHIQ